MLQRFTKFTLEYLNEHGVLTNKGNETNFYWKSNEDWEVYDLIKDKDGKFERFTYKF